MNLFELQPIISSTLMQHILLFSYTKSCTTATYQLKTNHPFNPSIWLNHLTTSCQTFRYNEIKETQNEQNINKTDVDRPQSAKLLSFST